MSTSLRFILKEKFHKFIPKLSLTVMTLSFWTDRSGQTVQTQIRLLLEEQSDQGLHCLQFQWHLFDKIFYGLASLFEFYVVYSKVFWRPKI